MISFSAFTVVAFSLVLGGQAALSASASAAAATHTKYPWKGHDPACDIRLHNPGATIDGVFTTCPPKRVLLLGDSLALTMGIQMALHEANWGTIIDDAALNGCGFVNAYRVEYQGSLVAVNPHCDNEATVWSGDVTSFRPQAIVIELGWWDSFAHQINGATASLGQPQYDALVEQQIVGLIHVIRSVSAAPIYFLSVPWMQPQVLPNGQQDPAASASSHAEINSLIQTAAQSSNAVHFVDISPYITPSGHFQTNVDGGICRASDGVHLYYAPAGTEDYVHTHCGEALQKGVLSIIRQDLAHK
jgi:hypothetical protein